MFGHCNFKVIYFSQMSVEMRWRCRERSGWKGLASRGGLRVWAEDSIPGFMFCGLPPFQRPSL